MQISVVIATHNRCEQLRHCLTAVTRQTRPAHEIIVVDDASTDSTKELIQTDFPAVTYLRQSARRGPAAARNRGIQVAGGDLIAFTDDDCRPPPEWLAQLLAGFQKYPQAGAVGGIQIPPQRLQAKYALARYETFVTQRVYKVGQNIVVGKPAPGGTNNLAVPRRLLAALGGFDERFPVAAGEDADLLQRIVAAGHVTVCLPAPVYHHPPYSFRHFCRQQLRRGIGAGYFNHKYGRQRPLLPEVARLLLTPLLFFLNLARYRDARNASLHTIAGFLQTIGRMRSRPALPHTPRRVWQHAPSPIKLSYLQKYATGRTALDVGAGMGFYSRWLAQHGRNVTAIDRYPPAGNHQTVIQADLTALPLCQKFDTVICFDVLEHVADEAAALAELRRVTRRRLLLSVPNEADDLLRGYNLTYKHHVDKTHFREYQIQELKQKLEQHGFHVIHIAPEGPVHPALFAEFIRPRWLRPFFRLLIRALHKVKLLHNDTLKADLFAVAEPARAAPSPSETGPA